MTDPDIDKPPISSYFPRWLALSQCPETGRSCSLHVGDTPNGALAFSQKTEELYRTKSATWDGQLRHPFLIKEQLSAP